MLKGLGFWIWQLPATSGGNVGDMVTECLYLGIGHVLIKVNEGGGRYQKNAALLRIAVSAFREAGIQVVFWGYNYPSTARIAGKLASEICQEFQVGTYVNDAEIEWENAGGVAAMHEFLNGFRNSSGGHLLALGLSTFAFPSLHGSFPYAAAFDKDKNALGAHSFLMPQVYQSPLVAKLKKSLAECLQFTPNVFPTGRAYLGEGVAGVEQVAADIRALHAVIKQGEVSIPCLDYWVMQVAEDYPEIMDALATNPFRVVPPAPLTVEQRVERLERGVFG